MDGYPAGSLDHNVPFLVAAGLNAKTNELLLDEELKDQRVLLRSDLPPVESKEVEVLEQYFSEIDAKSASWTGFSKEETYRFRIKSVGRSFLLPPRQARLPSDIEPLEANPILHSPFSPLSPVSKLYPDGLLDAQWIKKHQDLVPSVYASFYTLTSDPNSKTLNDNHIKTDISNLRGLLARSGYKTRLAVVLLGEEDVSPTDGIQERLENLRRGAALDPKSVFYIPPQESPDELKRVIDNILGVLYTTAVDYYRDLGRHARKKRSRGIAPQPTVPPTSGTSRTLSLPDWNFRYDFKSAVFAEFRQEFDAALRSFEQAYEILLGQDVFDVMPIWSPRWNEARLLSDVISIRCLRCHLWMGQPTLAARRWQAHRDRIGDFVDRRGRGTNNYGWQAWEARWAMVMANLIEKVEVPGLDPSTSTLFLQPEKAVLGERLQPWEMLHHTGYWYKIAARHLGARRNLAARIPEEDRHPPDATPASQTASKGYAYDTYMCPEPYEEKPISGMGVNHGQLIIDCLKKGATQFQARNQTRIAAELAVDCARELVLLEQWQDAVDILRPVWDNMLFRAEGWLDISGEVCWLVRRAAAGAGNADLVLAADWELMNGKFLRRPQWHYDIEKALEGVTLESKPSITLSDEAKCSFVTASFVFRNKEGKAGETCCAQLALTSHAFLDAVPVEFSSVRVQFEGNLRPILLEPASVEDEEPSDKSRVSISKLTLDEDLSEQSEDDLPTLLRGKSRLTLKPGETRVFELTIPLREPGPTTASSVVLSLKNEAFDLDYKLDFPDHITGWYIPGAPKPRAARPGARILQIQPRPPKMEIKLAGSPSQFYTNEAIQLEVELFNAEQESANLKLDVHLLGKEVPALRVQAEGHEEQLAEPAPEGSIISGLVLGSVDSSASLKLVLNIDPVTAPTSYEVHFRASYHLASDSVTPITQMLPVQLNVVNPFEANYDMVPRLHPDPWPSLFDAEGLGEGVDGDSDGVARGLAQKWCLVCHFASFAQADLRVVGMQMEVTSCVGGARYNVTNGPEVPQEGLLVGPRTMHEVEFDLMVQKLSLDDKHPVSLNLAFVIRWRREGITDGPINTTSMPLGPYFVLGTEPRVLASVYQKVGVDPVLIQLDTTIENPSNHFLTFGLSMEPSDEFAFSGSKTTTLNLLPMSRRTTTYRLLPLVRGAYVRPGLSVRDKYFQKVLRIIPTEGMKIDKDGLLVWVPEDGEQEADVDVKDG